MNPQDWIGLGIFVLLILILFLVYSSHRQRESNELRRSLIDKFGSAQDLGAFLQSEGGKRFLAEMGSGAAGAYGSIMASVQKGIILVLIGVGCCAAAGFTSTPAIMGIGLVLILAGAGFLVSAVVTYILSRSWGLLGKRSDS